MDVDRSPEPLGCADVLLDQRLPLLLPVKVDGLGALVLFRARPVPGQVRDCETPIHAVDIDALRLPGPLGGGGKPLPPHLACAEEVLDQRGLAGIDAAKDADLRELGVDAALAVLKALATLEAPDAEDVRHAAEDLLDGVGGLVPLEGRLPGLAAEEEGDLLLVSKLLAPRHLQHPLRLQQPLVELRDPLCKGLNTTAVVDPPKLWHREDLVEVGHAHKLQCDTLSLRLDLLLFLRCARRLGERRGAGLQRDGFVFVWHIACADTLLVYFVVITKCLLLVVIVLVIRAALQEVRELLLGLLGMLKVVEE
mmetsp:Transcript_39912/g.124348  ORF Transcript_39912/g.124348 Transcript_39912/m.124348 type:complete len:309 (-) Transcript_39912:731-1657(-)